MVEIMARSKPIVLQSRTFATQGAAKVYFGEMLKRYTPGDRVTTEDAKCLEGLLHRHPEATAKIGVGIDHFEVQSADFGSQCFRVVRTDETWARFSYNVCIAPDRDWK